MDESTKTASRKCRYEQCGRIVWEDDDKGCCVFHSARSEEKAKAFARAWVRFLKKHEAGDGAYRYLNCRGFVFPGPLSFARATLGGGADFREARFGGSALFEGTRFRENIYFSGARFEGDARFEGAQLDKAANFDDTRFDAEASFEGVRFAGRAEFRRSHFEAEGRFGDAGFDGDALFRDGQFPGGLRFLGARFEGRLDFEHATGGPVSLEKADLTGADLRECSLRNLQITHVTRHKGVRFGPTDLSGVDWTGSDGLREQALHQNHIYDFRRKNSLCRYILFPIWKATSDCGRSIRLWAAWSVGLPVGFGALYAWQGNRWFAEARSWDALTPYLRSASTFATLGFHRIQSGSTGARAAVGIEALLGWLMLGGLITILVKRFRRSAP